MQKILVTGGAGYIGAHTVVELQAAGYQPIIIDDFSKSDQTLLDGIEKITGVNNSFYEGNCCDQDFLRSVFKKEQGIAGVMHFAAYKSVGESVEQPLLYYRNNLDSLLSLMEVMGEFEVTSLIFSSSCTVYGEPDHIPVDENATFKKAESPYGATKQMCERILEDTTAADKKLKTISLRYFNPIGAHPSALIGELPIDRPNNLVPFITQTAAGVREKLTIFGNDYDTPDGTCIRDFIHVVDLAKAHVAAFELLATKDAAYYDIFNVGTGEGNTVLQLITAFEKVNNLKLNYEIGPRRPGDVEKIYGDVSKAAKLMNWQTEKTLEDSMQDAWRWEKKVRGIEG